MKNVILLIALAFAISAHSGTSLNLNNSEKTFSSGSPVVSPSPAKVVNVYVNNTPGVGNDFNPGTLQLPKQTISSAINNFPSGTVIL